MKFSHGLPVSKTVFSITCVTVHTFCMHDHPLHQCATVKKPSVLILK